MEGSLPSNWEAEQVKTPNDLPREYAIKCGRGQEGIFNKEG